MTLEWSEELATGNATIDSQHKELFSKFAELREAMENAAGGEDDDDTVGHVILFLEDYVIRHFSTEENLMDKYNFPESNPHKMQHATFIRNLENFKRDFKGKGTSVALAEDTQRWLATWLCDHIARTDKSLGAFLKGKV